jgi:hypothetical protein
MIWSYYSLLTSEFISGEIFICTFKMESLNFSEHLQQMLSKEKRVYTFKLELKTGNKCYQLWLLYKF